MDSKEYEDSLKNRIYNGLQLKRMTKEEAYQFAVDPGMRAIITSKSYPFEIQMVILYRSKVRVNCLQYIKNGYVYKVNDDQDIYWIGLK